MLTRKQVIDEVSRNGLCCVSAVCPDSLPLRQFLANCNMIVKNLSQPEAPPVFASLDKECNFISLTATNSQHLLTFLRKRVLSSQLNGLSYITTTIVLAPKL